MTWNGIRLEEKGRTRGGNGLRKGRDGLMMIVENIKAEGGAEEEGRYDRVRYNGMGLE